ncbi:hypothetical protein LY15_004038 [Prauserella flava]|nr:hypothetical protein [Prauserella flava]MCR3736046.1 hypothetical protein [Prauserella salsuginis]
MPFAATFLSGCQVVAALYCDEPLVDARTACSCRMPFPLRRCGIQYRTVAAETSGARSGPHVLRA